MNTNRLRFPGWVLLVALCTLASAGHVAAQGSSETGVPLRVWAKCRSDGFTGQYYYQDHYTFASWTNYEGPTRYFSFPNGEYCLQWYVGTESQLSNYPWNDNWLWGASWAQVLRRIDYFPNLLNALRSEGIYPFGHVYTALYHARHQISSSFSLVGNFPLTSASTSGIWATEYNANQDYTGSPMIVRLEPGKTYTLNGSWSGIAYGEVNVAAPPQYRVILNGVERNRCGMATTISIAVERRSQGPAGAAGFSSNLAADRLDWRLPLGTLRNGDDAGAISLVDPGTGPNWNSVFSPSALSCNPVSDEVYVHRTGNTITQVIANQIAVDIERPGNLPNGFVIKCYSTAQLLNASPPCTFSGLPFVTYTVRQSDDPADPATALKIIREFRNIVNATAMDTPVCRTETTKLVRTGPAPNFTWTKTDWHSGTSPLQETSATFATSGATRSESIALRTPGNPAAVALSASRTYSTYSFGEEVSAETVGSSDPRTVTFNYHSDVNSPGSLGYVESVRVSGGGWEAYDYHASDQTMSYQGGRVKYRYRPNGAAASETPSRNTQVGEVTYFEYGPDPFGSTSRPTLLRTTVDGTETGKTTIVYDSTTAAIVTSTRNDHASASVPLTTITRYYLESGGDAFIRGKPVSIRQPDGVTSHFTYEKGSWDGTTFTPNGTPATASRISVATTPSDGAPLERVSTKEVTIRDARALVARTETFVSKNGAWESVAWTNFTYNFAGLLTGRVSNNGATYSAAWDGNLKLTETDENGTGIGYTHDAAGRVQTSTRAGAASAEATIAALTTSFVYDAANRVLQQRIGPAAGESLLSTLTYDDSGRVQSETAPGLGTTRHTYNVATRKHTVIRPDGSTLIDTAQVDGRLASKTGTGAVAQFFSYGIESDGRRWSKVEVATQPSPRWTKFWVDWLGRKTVSQRPGFGGVGLLEETQTYDANIASNTGRLLRTNKPGVAPTLFEYNAMSQLTRSGLDIDASGTLLPASTDRIADASEIYEFTDGDWWLTKTDSHYPYEGTNAATAAQVAKTSRRLTGLGGTTPAGQLREDTRTWDLFNNETRRTVAVDAANKIATVTTTRVGLGSLAQIEKLLNGLPISTKSFEGHTRITAYDALARPFSVSDPRTGATTTAYHPNTKLVKEVKDPALKRLVFSEYDTSGRPVYQETAHPTIPTSQGFTTRTAYTPRGEVAQTWGTATYPVTYDYNEYGGRTKQRTYQDVADAALNDTSTFPAVGLGNETTWEFDAASGLLKRKYDAKTKFVEYDYDTAGRLWHRYWARTLPSSSTRVTTTYLYHAATGEQTGIAYNDGTPALVYAYNRLGQNSGVIQNYADNPLDTLFDLCRCGKLMAEYFDPEYFGPRTLTHDLDFATTGYKGRTIGYTLTVNTTPEQSVGYQFDSATGRLASVANSSAIAASNHSFRYAYETNSNLVRELTVDTTHPFKVTRAYENQRDLLLSVATTWNTATRARYAYTYDHRRQRASVVQAGDVFADYGGTGSDLGAIHQVFHYNGRGELLQSPTYLGPLSAGETDANFMSGRKHEFTYDGIGNRRTSNSSGAAGLGDNYRVNELNQYISRENNSLAVGGTVADLPGTRVVAGANALTYAGRHGRHWGDNVLLDNLNGPFLGSLTVYAGQAGGAAGGADLLTSASRTAFLPPVWQTFSYDADGNVLTDGVWKYTWDAENRLIGMETMPEAIGPIPAAHARKLSFKYDHLGRRIGKTVYSGWNGAYYAGTPVELRFLYDGWNLIAEYTVVSLSPLTLTLSRSYTWGLDIVGSLTEAGGVGALLQIANHASGKSYFPAYDGNGNLAALFDSVTTGPDIGACVATYEYSPYGEFLRCEGASARENPFRFSTKFTDDDSGLVYYGRRYYNPSQGRFLGRDPIEENGGLHLYGFVGNNPINRWDILGMQYPGGLPENQEQATAALAAYSHGGGQALSMYGYWGDGSDYSTNGMTLAQVQAMAGTAILPAVNVTAAPINSPTITVPGVPTYTGFVIPGVNIAPGLAQAIANIGPSKADCDKALSDAGQFTAQAHSTRVFLNQQIDTTVDAAFWSMMMEMTRGFKTAVTVAGGVNFALEIGHIGAAYSAGRLPEWVAANGAKMSDFATVMNAGARGEAYFAAAMATRNYAAENILKFGALAVLTNNFTQLGSALEGGASDVRLAGMVRDTIQKDFDTLINKSQSLRDWHRANCN